MRARLQLERAHERRHALHHLARELALHGEHVGEVALEALAPDDAAVARVGELGDQQRARIRGLHAAREHVLHAEHLADAPHAERRAAERHRRQARDDEEVGHARERGDGVVGQAVADRVEARVVRAQLERDHRDRRPAVRLHRGARRPDARLRRRPDAERAHRAAAVAQALLAEVLDRGVDAAGELVAHLRRDDGLAGVGQLGQPGGDVDAVAEHVERLDDHLGDVDADAHAERRRASRRR